jgi:thiamine-phosphate diphosphorylase
MPLIDVPTVHAVTDPGILTDPGFKSRAEAVFHALGPAGAVHLRGPGVSAKLIYLLALDLAPLQEVTGCRLVVNDRPDIARATGAWGVQLTERSLDVPDARLAGGALALGRSVHSADGAREAFASGAAWVIAGPIYPTPTHPGDPGRGEKWLREFASAGGPVIAIGGIHPSQVSNLKSQAAHGVAVRSGVWLAADPGAAAAEYL